MRNSPTLRACLALAAVGLAFGAPAAQAVDMRVDASSERLDQGDTWNLYGMSFDGKATVGVPLRLHARLEQEQRRFGVTERAYLQASTSVGEKSALEVGVGLGSGAAYGLRQEQHVTFYTSARSVELSSGLYRVQYADSTLYRLATQARVPLTDRLTGIAGVTSGRAHGRFAGGFSSLGIEYVAGTCTVTAARYQGHEAQDPSQALSSQLRSHTLLAGLRCPVTRNVSFELTASATQAAALTRHGVSGALVIGF
jgi:hypothetical protein